MIRRTLILVAAFTVLGAVASVPVMGAVGTDTSELRNAVTVEGIRSHQAAFQDAADANGGTREASTPGYDASVDYVVAQLEDAGYEITVQGFDYFFSDDNTVPILERVEPTAISYLDGNSNFPDGDFASMTFTGNADLENTAVVGVDLAIDDPASSTSGCEPTDFDGVDVGGKIALMQRGLCSFNLKATNALAAGAAGAIVFNQGNTPDREGLFFGTLGTPVDPDFPVVSASFQVGVDLSEEDATANLSVDAIAETRTSKNVIANTPGGRDDRVVVVGAHLDSVPGGPGIQDNGSGSAAILEIALQMSELGIEPENQVRFAWWGAEESGLVGSQFYVDNLSRRETKNIALNLNFDMIGSPNFVRFVYDGDGSDTPLAGPNGSSAIENVFLDYFAGQGLATEATAFDGRSDYGPFIAVGIPAGGLFTGAEGIKTPEEVDIYGGTAGEQYDPCYHLACDTFDNISLEALDQMSDAAAHAVLTFAMTESAVNGTAKGKGKGVTDLQFKGSNALK
ncbi:MAG: M20/M25/M40 family metallo-hydrolase [Acidimicrobiales bacterium]